MYRDYGRYIFYLFVLMIVLVYYVGATKEAPVFAQSIVQLFYAASGRNSQGNFANYPK